MRRNPQPLKPWNLLPCRAIVLSCTLLGLLAGRVPAEPGQQAAEPATTAADSRPLNVLLVCVDDLRPELNCFGVSKIHSPHIDALAARGVRFSRHYVQAPTCGASRCALLTGRYGGAGNDALFQRARQMADGREVPASLPAWFRQHGYTTVSVGKVSHHPGGRGGPDWDDDAQPEMPDAWDRHLLPAGPWQHPRGFMHGLAHGEIRENAKQMDVFQSAEGDDAIYPDGLTTAEALRQLDTLSAAEQPFFLAVGILRPHLPFGAPAKYMQYYEDDDFSAVEHPQKPTGKTTWHGSGEFMKYNRWGRNPNEDAAFASEVRRHYAACVSYADAQVGRLLTRLDELGQREQTVIVLWGDHGWHLGEHAVWGKHTLFEESLRSPLIVSHPSLEQPGRQTSAVVETIDIFPTLCDLGGLPQPDDLPGVSLAPLLAGSQEQGHAAVSYFGKDRTLRTDSHRLIVHGDGFVELYDHGRDPGETRNIADQSPELVAELSEQLNRRRPK